jgi:CubicO group peptidase (beta-lactamase class C family)
METNMEKIRRLEPLMSRICKIGGAPALSIGVAHHGESLYQHHIGTRDIDTGEAPDGDTVYYIGSLTKAMTSALVGIIVDEGVLEWTTPVCEIIPELKESLGGFGRSLTILDLLSHRTGASRSDALWLQSAGNILLPKSEGIATFISQPMVREFRADYFYNNFGYDVAGKIVEKLTGKSLGVNMRQKMFEPLGMTRTSVEEGFAHDSNFAKAYSTLKDGTPFEIPRPTISDQTLMGPAGGVRSCINDLCRFYLAFMRAANDQFENKSTSMPDSPFKQLIRVLTPHNQLVVTSLREQSYCLGWGRAELPCTLGNFNYNKGLVSQMPIIGKGVPSRLVVYHGGSLQGFTSTVFTLPESETAIVTLQNSHGLCDPCDWIAQLLIDTLFGTTEPVDMARCARESALKGASLMDTMQDDLEKARTPGTKPRPLNEYTGRYQNRIQNFFIDITVGEDRELRMCFQGMESEVFRLRHYHFDEFVWNESHDETAKRGRFESRPLNSYKIRFESKEKSDSQGKGIDCLIWKLDDNMKTGEVFMRQE